MKNTWLVFVNIAKGRCFKTIPHSLLNCMHALKITREKGASSRFRNAMVNAFGDDGILTAASFLLI